MHTLRRWLGLLLITALLCSLWLPGAAVAGEKQTYLIGFERPVGPAEQNLVRGAGGSVRHSFALIPVIAADLPPAAATALANNPRVRYVEPNITVRAVESIPWGIERVAAPPAWTQSTGAGVPVAVLDTGIDPNHPDLAVAGGYNAFTGQTGALAAADGHGHGTHVAGTVAALHNGIGVVGVAPAAALWSVKVLDDGGSGTALSVAQGIEWAVQNDIRIISMSLGTTTDSSTIRAAVEAAHAAGALLIAAAGNSGNPGGRSNSVEYPARYAQVVAVAASDSNNRRASFSSTGPAVELIAPGVGVLSTYLGGGYAEASGTSMAAPHVSGVAALVWAANPGLARDDVRGILQATALDLGLSANWQGYGLVQADQAVAAAGGGDPAPPPDDPEPPPDDPEPPPDDPEPPPDDPEPPPDDPEPPPDEPLAVAVATDEATYSKNSRVSITTVVTAGGEPIAGASVDLTVYAPNGSVFTRVSGTTGSNGAFTAQVRIRPRDPTGAYLVRAESSKDGHATGSGETSFTVR